MSPPVYLALPEGAALRACRDAFAGAHVEVRPLDAILQDEELDAGLVVIDQDEADRRGLQAAATLHRRGKGWTVARLLAGDGGLRVQGLSLAFAGPLDEAAAAWVSEDRPGPLLELRSTLREIARARHDINNPLTSALAEVQLLLMDVTDDEIRAGLDVIQEQLRRIRDLVASTSHLRAPRR